MSMPGIKRYTFETAAQWRSGASRQLAFESRTVTTSARYSTSRIAGTSSKDASAAFTSEYCADLLWVRRKFALIRTTKHGLRKIEKLSIGQAASTWKAGGLVSGKTRLWLLLRRRGDRLDSLIYRYNVQGRARRRIELTNRPVLAMCTDRHDGIWVVLGGDTRNAEVMRIHANGDVGARYEISAPVTKAAIASTCDGKRLVVLDYMPQIDKCEPQKSWRLWSIDLCDKDDKGEVKSFVVLYSLPQRDAICHTNVPSFRPQLLAIDCDDVIHVMRRQTGELWSLDPDGFVIRQHSRTLDRCDLPVAGLVADRRLSVSARRGVFRLSETRLAETTSESYQPTYITPMMTSPDGEQSGWTRADIDVDLMPGVIVEVNIATSNDTSVATQANRIMADRSVPRAAQIAQLESHLPWRSALTRRYQANGDTVRSIHVPLHSITDTYVWLRIRVYTESGAQVPTIRRMRVYYPNISYMQYLPAVYRANETAAEFLRSFMAMFETMFGNLDTELAELPSRIDPGTAPDDWLPYLLRWLGLPAATELSPAEQRRLLIAAPELLRARGTLHALESLLEILAGPTFEVLDSGREAGPWVLPDACRPGVGGRLGQGTLVFTQERPAFRLGCTSRLNTRRLGYQKTDPSRLFLRRHALVQIRIVADRADRERLSDLLDRYLPFFIPAHCRYTTRFVDASEVRGHGRLDDDLRLADEGPRRLGDVSIVGTLSLGSVGPVDAATDSGQLDVDLFLS